jgi:hypothetical protein
VGGSVSALGIEKVKLTIVNLKINCAESPLLREFAFVAGFLSTRSYQWERSRFGKICFNVLARRPIQELQRCNFKFTIVNLTFSIAATPGTSSYAL